MSKGDSYSGFYGLVLEADGKPVSVKAPCGHSVRIRHAALDMRSWVLNAKASLVITASGGDYVVCNLTAAQPNQSLDLLFAGGQTMVLRANGNASLHLTGYFEPVTKAGGNNTAACATDDDAKNDNTRVSKQEQKADDGKARRNCVVKTLTAFVAKCEALPADALDRNTYGKSFEAMLKIAVDLTNMKDDASPRITSLDAFVQHDTQIPETDWPAEILLYVFRAYDELLDNDVADFWDEKRRCLQEMCGLCESHLAKWV
jgi:hypothetical protein